MRVRSRINSRKKGSIKLILFSLLVIGSGLLLPRFISLVSAVVMTPVQVVSIWLDNSSSLVPVFIRGRLALQEEIIGLKQDLVIAGQADLTKQRLWEDNNRLRQLLNIAIEERIVAAVVARPSDLPYDLLQIDQGSDSGIEVGAPVFVGKDVVIGLVVHTAAKYSFVELITTAQFETSVFISGPNVVVKMEGVGGGVARVRVPQGVPLSIGNLVYLPSVEPGVFGRIIYIENNPTQPEQFGYITPQVAISSLYQVAVGKRSQVTRSVEEIDENIRKKLQQELLVKGITVGVISTTTAEAASSSQSES